MREEVNTEVEEPATKAHEEQEKVEEEENE